MNAEIMVPGIPEPKGSFTPVKRGKKIFLMDGRDGKTHERRKDWKHRVAFFGAAYMRANHVLLPCNEPMAMDLTFYMPRPKSISKRRVHCSVKPDIDKLARGCL